MRERKMGSFSHSFLRCRDDCRVLPVLTPDSGHESARPRRASERRGQLRRRALLHQKSPARLGQRRGIRGIQCPPLLLGRFALTAVVMMLLPPLLVLLLLIPLLLLLLLLLLLPLPLPLRAAVILREVAVLLVVCRPHWRTALSATSAAARAVAAASSWRPASDRLKASYAMLCK